MLGLSTKPPSILIIKPTGEVMEIYNNPTMQHEIISRVKQKHNLQTRTRPGLHISDLIYCLTKKYWSVKQPNVEIIDDDALMFAVGLGLERVLLEDSDIRNRPGMVSVDGIYFSADYLIKLNNTLGELKTTRASYNKDGEPSKGYPATWIRQIAGYCYAYGVVKFNLAVYQVIQAKLYTKQINFTQQELDEYWSRYVIPRRDIINNALSVNLPPEPYKYNESWECARCPYQMMCASTMLAAKHGVVNYIPATEPMPDIPASMVVTSE